jgi:acetolactate synthase-1/2/3 large subunit
MARKNGRTDVSRRKFLAGAAVAGAASAIPAVKGAKAADADTAAFVKRPSTAAAQAEMAGNVAASPGTLGGPPGSDFMVDVLRSVEIDFVFSNPASSCRGIHESIVNYGGKQEAGIHNLHA